MVVRLPAGSISRPLALLAAGVAEKGWKVVLKTWNSLQNRIMTFSMP